MTKAGSSDLERPIAIRPTSETVMYPYYAKVGANLPFMPTLRRQGAVRLPGNHELRAAACHHHPEEPRCKWKLLIALSGDTQSAEACRTGDASGACTAGRLPYSSAEPRQQAALPSGLLAPHIMPVRVPRMR